MENFGCFQDKTVNFDSGFNQLIGANESGKSTVIKALFTAVFEDGTTRRKAILNWGRWSTNQTFRLTLKFSVGDKDFALIRDFGTGPDTMTDSDGITYEGKAIKDKLSLYFGAADRSLFESVFCFSSDSPAAPESTKEKLQSAVETPVFYGFDRSRADRFLDEEIKKLDNPRAHGPRELDIISDQISARLQEKSELDKRMEALKKDNKELDEVRSRLQEHEEAITRLDKEIEGATIYYGLNEKMVGLEERLQVHLSNYSRAVQVSEDLERINKEMECLSIPSPEEMADISVRGEELNSRVEESKQAMDNLISRRSKAKKGFAGATLMLVLLCLAYVFQQNDYIPSGTVADILPYTIPVMIIAWIARMSVYLNYYFKKKNAAAVFHEQVAELDALFAGLNEKYNLKAADAIRGLEEAVQRKEALEISSQNLQNTIEALSEGRGLEYLDQIRGQIEQEVAQLNQELAAVTAFTAASTRLPELKEELISRRVRANAMRERSALLTERCSAMEPLARGIEKVEEEFEILKRKHKDVTEKIEVLKITRNALNRAADQLIEDTFEAYGASASSFLTSLTGGRFDQVRFCRELGRFEVKAGDSDRWIEITDALSSSTRDCIYLALRMAAGALLSAEFIPPMILDQAETRMDSTRKSVFYKLIRQILERRQVIYLGLEKVDQWADSNVIFFEPAGKIAQPSATF